MGDEPQREALPREAFIGNLRKLIDACIQVAEEDLRSGESGRPDYKREMALARTKLQESKMWLGKCYEKIGVPLPSSYHKDEAE